MKQGTVQRAAEAPSGVTYKQITLTPEMAAEWLRTNHSNRPVRKRRVEQFAADMAAGNWAEIGQPIVFGKSNRMINGQHRCMACVKAGATIKVTVVHGVEDSAFSLMDDGAPRSLADVLIEEGWKIWEAKVGASVIRYCIGYAKGNFGITLPNHVGVEYVLDNPDLMSSVEFVAKLPRRPAPMPHSIAAFLHFEMVKAMKKEKHGAWDPAADVFITKLFTGENLTSDDIVLQLRNKLIGNALSAAKSRPEMTAAAIVRVWNSLVRGQPIKHVNNAFRREGAFPRILG